MTDDEYIYYIVKMLKKLSNDKLKSIFEYVQRHFL